MRRIWISAVLVLLMAGAASVMGQRDSKMQSYLSAEGGFTVQFPAGSDVKQDAEEVTLEDGGKSTLHEFSVDLDNDSISYMVMYNDYPAASAMDAPQEVLAKTRDGALKDKTEISDLALDFNGIPGREFSASDDNYTYTVRQFLKGKRLYQLIVVCDKEKIAGLTSQFLNSFKFQ